MRLKRAIPAAIGLAALAAARVAIADSMLPRGALGAVVRSCVLAKRTLGTPFPCLEVRLPDASDPGFTVIRAPGEITHIIVTPTEQIPGIESATLLKPSAGAYWRAALEARPYVVRASEGRATLDAVGLALNSKRTRSQDQLHIHAECVRPEVLRAIRAQAAEIGPAWRALAHPVDHDRMFARTISGAALAHENLFQALSELPGVRSDLAHVTVLVVAAGASADPDRFYVVAGASRGRSIEGYLDDSCRQTGRAR